VTASALATRHRNLIITLAARHKLPAVYSDRWFVTDGGLLSYGPDYVDQFRRAAGNPKNLAKVDLWTFLLLRRFSALLGRSVVDFG
jgi:putative tryptophan/tyrosine transport system substrate-binding protein